MPLHLLHIVHRHGDAYSLHATYTEAEEALTEWVDDWWDQDGPGREGDAKPADTEEARDAYFEFRGDFESFAIEPVEAPPVTVVVVRDPDSSNDISVFGTEATIIDVDLGYSNLTDRDEFLDWTGAQLGTVDDLAKADPDNPAIAVVLRAVTQTIEASQREFLRDADTRRATWSDIDEDRLRAAANEES